jgi:predicted DNA-binding transcriptional regulator AlpA
MREQAHIPRTYTAEQIATILQVPRDEVYRMGESIPGRFRLGGRTRWRAADVDLWLGGSRPGKVA